jgi:hypothetical protein
MSVVDDERAGGLSLKPSERVGVEVVDALPSRLRKRGAGSNELGVFGGEKATVIDSGALAVAVAVGTADGRIRVFLRRRTLLEVEVRAVAGGEGTPCSGGVGSVDRRLMTLPGALTDTDRLSSVNDEILLTVRRWALGEP